MPEIYSSAGEKAGRLSCALARGPTICSKLRRGGAIAAEHGEAEVKGGRGFHWGRWTIVGCLAWIAIVVLTGGSVIALILTPVVGPLGGWLVGGMFYLLTGALMRPSR